MFPPALIVHGGAGSRPADLSAAQHAGCSDAVAAGWQVLHSGGTAIDAVCAAVVCMENHPAFNAGLGSCLTNTGTVEMDASVMDGQTLRAGAVAVVSGVPNPVRLARALMDEERHLMVAGSEATALATKFGIDTCAPDALVTERQRQLWQQRAGTPGTGTAGTGTAGSHATGTVGAVAVDRNGHVAAATSTGGIFFKHPGRVGDSALIGAGTYADDALGAASTTGIGEAIIRVVLAYRVVDALRGGCNPADVARAGIEQLAQRTGAVGGVIVVDPRGRVGFASNTPQMTVGYMRDDLPEPVIQG